MCCCRASQCQEIFTAATARRNLKRYRRKGLGGFERRMVDGIPAREVGGARVLEIGGGIGAIQSELLAKGAQTGEIVELVPAYAPYARELAQEKGFTNQSTFRVADVLEDPHTISPAAIVVLNRVVCCSPDGIRLTATAARLAERVLLLSYPRDRMLTRTFAKTLNGVMPVLGRSFRTYLHPRAALLAAAQETGLRLARTGHNLAWEFAVFEHS